MRLERRMKPNVEVSTAPIADIVFLLLIYFMLTSSFVINNSLEVDLPQSSSNKPHKGGHTVTITKDLVYAWDQQTVEKEQVPAFIEEVLTNDDEDDNTITLRTDKAVTMEDVAYVMSAVAKDGGKIVILTRKE
jgi:biopolymer transport protein ExbD